MCAGCVCWVEGLGVCGLGGEAGCEVGGVRLGVWGWVCGGGEAGWLGVRLGVWLGV